MGTEPAPLRPDRAHPAAHPATGPASGAASSARAAAPAGAGDRFRELLDGLAGRAQELDRAAQDLSGPAALAGALETARASLEDALSLREQIVAAYREALQRENGGPAGP